MTTVGLVHQYSTLIKNTSPIKNWQTEKISVRGAIVIQKLKLISSSKQGLVNSLTCQMSFSTFFDLRLLLFFWMYV